MITFKPIDFPKMQKLKVFCTISFVVHCFHERKKNFAVFPKDKRKVKEKFSLLSVCLFANLLEK